MELVGGGVSGRYRIWRGLGVCTLGIEGSVRGVGYGRDVTLFTYSDIILERLTLRVVRIHEEEICGLFLDGNVLVGCHDTWRHSPLRSCDDHDVGVPVFDTHRESSLLSHKQSLEALYDTGQNRQHLGMSKHVGRLVECKIGVLGVGFDIHYMVADLGYSAAFIVLDNINSVIIPFKLLCTENYRIWSGAVKLALQARNKYGFVDGTCLKESYATSDVLSA
ncbi:ribonuclease H-like domain-containing protein [Tanacetum coccineum]